MARADLLRKGSDVRFFRTFDRDVSSFCLVAVACLAVLLVAGSTGAATGSCAAQVALFRERLELVTEAVIDNQPVTLVSTTARAQTWWRLHGAALGRHADADSLIPRMVTAARTRRPNEAAQIAVRLSVESFHWCDVAASQTDRVMIVDLAGMAGWLRARGAAADEPANSAAAVDSIAATLVHAGHAELATRLRAAYTAIQPRPGTKPADAKAAVRLLDLVDEVEKALH